MSNQEKKDIDNTTSTTKTSPQNNIDNKSLLSTLPQINHHQIEAEEAEAALISAFRTNRADSINTNSSSYNPTSSFNSSKPLLSSADTVLSDDYNNNELKINNNIVVGDKTEEEEEEEKEKEIKNKLYDITNNNNNNNSNKEKNNKKKEKDSTTSKRENILNSMGFGKKDKDKKEKDKDYNNNGNNNNKDGGVTSSYNNTSLNNSDSSDNNNNNNNNNNNETSPLHSSLSSKLAAVHAKDNKKVEMESMSKIINRSSNLTRSEPVIMDEGGSGGGGGSGGASGKPTSPPHSQSSVGLTQPHTKHAPLNKAQELPYQVIVLNDNESSVTHSSSKIHPSDSDHSDPEEEEEYEHKKKKKRSCRNIFSGKMVIIYVLILLLLITGVGVVFRIFLPDVKIVQTQILRWSLYLDVAILSFILAFWIIRGFFSLFQLTLFLQQHVYYYVNGFAKPLSFMIWAIVCLFATGPILDLPSYTDSNMEKYYTTMRAIIYVSLFYCGRVVLVKMLAAKTNRKAFYSTLKESLLNEELLEQMSTRKANRLGQSVSASLKKRKKRMDVAQWLQQLKNRSNLSGKLNSKADNYSTSEAKKVAKTILNNADRQKKGYIDRDDLKAYVKDKHLDKTYATFGSLYDDMITRDDLVNWVLRVVRSRKNLEYRLRDHEDIGRVINEVINFIFWILMFLFVMTLYGVDINVFLVPLSTTILALSFAFGTTLRNVFESLILIFFVRPFEVGDKVVVANEAYIVDRIGILFTAFKSTDGKAVYMPNPVLTSSKIENHMRSEEVWVGVDVIVNFTTPVEKLYMLEAKMNKWILAQKDKWKPDTSLTFVSIQGTNHITMRYGASIIASWQDAKRWRPIKNELLFKMKEWIEDLEFENNSVKQIVQLVNPPTGQSSIPTHNNFSSEFRMNE